MSEIFISYARSTEAQARQVERALRALGYDVWRDDELPAHRAYTDVIEERLRTSKAVVVLWSSDAVKSQWVQSEADHARASAKLVQLTIDGAMPPMPFDRIQCANLVGWTGELDAPGWAKVAGSVAELVGRAPRRLRPTQRSELEAVRRAAPSPVRPVARPRVRPRRWSLAAAAVALALAVGAGGFFVMRRFLPSSPPVRVAVLPFDASGQGLDAARLSAAVVDQLGDAISAAHVDVVPEGDAAAALREPRGRLELQHLGVGIVVEGDVHSVGDTLQVHALVSDLTNHATLWSKSFVAPAGEADLLGARVVSRASSAVSLANDRSLAVLRGRPEVLAQFIDVALGDRAAAQQLALSRDLVAKAPDVSLGHALLSNMIAVNAGLTLPPRAQASAVAEATQEAQLALRLDPSNDYAYAMLAHLRPFNDWSGQQALIAQGLAVRSDSAMLHLYQSYALRNLGRANEAVVEAERSLATNHADAVSRINVIYSLLESGKQAEAAAAAAEGRRIWPQSFLLLWSESDVAALSSPPSPQIVAMLSDPARRSAYSAESLAALQVAYRAVVSGGATEKAAAAAQVRATALQGRMNSSDAIGALLNLGDQDGAFLVADFFTRPENLARSWSMEPLDVEMLFRPVAAVMRRDPRFPRLIGRLGLWDYWRRSGHWPDFCSEPGLPYDCKLEAARPASARS